MREIKIGTQGHTKVFAIDEPKFNANHVYEIQTSDYDKRGTGFHVANLRVCFQEGPVKEYGVNGVQNEDLLVIVIDRLQSFQKGDFVCAENEEALCHLFHALSFLNKRTARRVKAGVEGTSKKANDNAMS